MSTNRSSTIGEMKVSAAVRKLNPGIFDEIPERKEFRASEIEQKGGKCGVGGLPNVPAEHFPKKAWESVKPRLRQNRKGPNKLEQEFEAFLRAEWRGRDDYIHPQGMTLLLANGTRYTPDFIVKVGNSELESYEYLQSGNAGKVLAFETKGFMREDAAVKIKVAARLFPWIKIHLVTKRKKKDGGGWAIEEVLP